MKAIKLAREAAGWTQTQLAEKLGVGQDQITKWETGTRNPSKRSLVALGRAFGCAPEDLSGGEPPLDQIKISAVKRRTESARYPDTNAAIISQIPVRLIRELTAAQLVLVADAIDAAYHRGYAASGAEYLPADGVLYVDGRGYDMADIRKIKPISEV